MEGFYSIAYQGTAGSGMGMLALANGIVVGADIPGGKYDGTYTVLPDGIAAAVILTVPPGVPLVQGIRPSPTEYKMPISVTLPKDLGQQQPVIVPTPAGPVSVVFKKLR